MNWRGTERQLTEDAVEKLKKIFCPIFRGRLVLPRVQSFNTERLRRSIFLALHNHPKKRVFQQHWPEAAGQIPVAAVIQGAAPL
jgi:hypothetical protein